jgi:hypothetical protein
LTGIFAVGTGHEGRYRCDFNTLPSEFPYRLPAKTSRQNREIKPNLREITGNTNNLPLAAGVRRDDDRIDMCPLYQLS